MLNSIASKVISALFSEYIETVDSSQLEVAIWSGVVHLENVSIKNDALLSQSIPFVVKKGIVGTIDLKFPWTKLSSEACEITIRDVFLVATIAENFLIPIDLTNKTPKDDNESQNTNKNVSQTGLLTGILGQIINNLKFHVENFHVRIEIPIGTKYFALGVTFNAIDWFSVDDNGNPTFVSEDSLILKKNAKIQNLAIYIDTDATLISDDTSIFLKDMMDEIRSNNHEFLISPSTFEAAITNKKASDIPESISETCLTGQQQHGIFGLQTKIKIKNDELGLVINQQQWKCIQEMQRQFFLFNLKRKYSICGRPDHYPRSDRSSTYWWRYVHRAALEKLKKDQLDPQCIIQILKNRKEYLNLYTENRRQNRRSSVEMTNLEETLDTNAIAMLRILSKKEYDNQKTLAVDQAEISEIVDQSTFSGPFGVFLNINNFKIKLVDNNETITTILANSLKMEYKKNGYSSFTGFSSGGFKLVNEINSQTILECQINETDNLIAYYKVEPNMPPNIFVNSPQINFVFDYSFLNSMKNFFKKDKMLIETKEESPATIIQIQKAIENHIVYSIQMKIKGFAISILYNECDPQTVSFNFQNIFLEQKPNQELNPEDFETLYDHLSIQYDSVDISLNSETIVNPLKGKFDIDNAICSSDLFPVLKFDAVVDNDCFITLTTFDLNLLIQLYYYISDIIAEISTYEGQFEAEQKFHIQFNQVQFNVEYDNRQIYQIDLNDFVIAFSYKDFMTFLDIQTNSVDVFEFFNQQKSQFIVCRQNEPNNFIQCNGQMSKEKRYMNIYIRNTMLFGHVDAINFVINFFRFPKDYEVKLLLKDTPDPRNIWHKMREYPDLPKLEMSIIAEPFIWYMDDELGIVKGDSLTYTFWIQNVGLDMFIEFNHPIIETDKLDKSLNNTNQITNGIENNEPQITQLADTESTSSEQKQLSNSSQNEFQQPNMNLIHNESNKKITILDTNSDTPLKLEFHSYSMSASFSNTKLTMYYLWFQHFIRYITNLIKYGKQNPQSPGSLNYSDIQVEFNDLTINLLYNPKIDDFLVLKTLHAQMKTITIPSHFQFIIDELNVSHANRLFIKAPNSIIDMPMTVAMYQEGQQFNEIQNLEELIQQTENQLQSPETIKDMAFWIVGIRMTFSYDSIFVDYTHQICHTFRKCIYTLWDYDGPECPYSPKFEFLLQVNEAHIIFNTISKYANVIFNDFKYEIKNEIQDISIGDISVTPLLSKDISFSNNNIFQKYHKPTVNSNEFNANDTSNSNEQEQRDNSQTNSNESNQNKTANSSELNQISTKSKGIDSTTIDKTFRCTIKENVVEINFLNMNIFLHPTFILPLLYYIIDCPLFGEQDDPKPDKPLYLIFKSDELHMTIPTRSRLKDIDLSFGFEWDWGNDDFIVNVFNFIATAEDREVPLVEPVNFEYKIQPSDSTSTKLYTQTALVTELNMTITILDLVNLNNMINLMAPYWDSEYFSRSSTNKDYIYDRISMKAMGMKVLMCHAYTGMNAKFPFMKMNISSFDFDSTNDNEYSTIESTIVTSISIMNFTSGTWDYLVEPFTTHLLGKSNHVFNELTISFLKEIDVNITTTFLKQAMEFAQNDFSSDLLEQQDIQNSSISFLSIENRTGSDVVIFMNDNKLIPLPIGSRIPLNVPQDTVLNVSFGDSMNELCNFKPESIVYPTYIHQHCVVNSIPFKGTRLLTLSSPFAVDNKTSLDLEIYSVSEKTFPLTKKSEGEFEKHFLGKVEAHSVFSLPYNVFLNNGFIFKDVNIPISEDHEIFKHKKWTTKLNKTLQILTKDGPLSCKIREDIDPNQNIGFIHIIPSVTFYNELPVDLTIQLSRSNANIFIKSGQMIDVPNIGANEITFKCCIKIDGYEFSQNKLVSLSFDTSTPSKFFLPKINDPNTTVGIATLTNHSIDKSQASVIFYSPCILFNLFGRDLVVKAHEEEENVYSFSNNDENQKMLMFASHNFFKNRQLLAHFKCCGLSNWSENYVDCNVTGMTDILYLPRIESSDVFVPIRYKITHTKKPFFHSTVLTLVPALSIVNELDEDIFLEPDSYITEEKVDHNNPQDESITDNTSNSINQNSQDNQNQHNSSPDRTTKQNANIEAANNQTEDDTSLNRYNQCDDDQNQEYSNASNTINQTDNNDVFRQKFQPHIKSNCLSSNNNFSYSLFIKDYSVCKGIILSSPMRTVFRIFKNNEYTLIECEVVEDGFGLCAHFRRPTFPSPFIFCNYIEDITFTGYQINQKSKFIFKPMTTSVFALDSPFGEQAMIIEYKNKSIYFQITEETIPLPLTGTPFTIEIRAVENGNQMIIISRDPVTITRSLFNVSILLTDLSISIIDSLLREICLVNFDHLNINLSTTQTDYLLSITLDDFQIDDQCLVTAFPVVLKGSSTKKHHFLELKSQFYRGAPFLISFKSFHFTLQKIIVYADLAFISDICYLILDTFYSKDNVENKNYKIKPPSESTQLESESVGQIYSFEEFRLDPILFLINYRSVTGRELMIESNQELPLTIFKLIGNITGANVCLNCIILKNFRAPFSYLQRNILTQITNSFMSQIWSITGHSDILFNTVGIAESFSSGVKSYYYDPDTNEEEEEQNEETTTEDISSTQKSESSILTNVESNNSVLVDSTQALEKSPLSQTAEINFNELPANKSYVNPALKSYSLDNLKEVDDNEAVDFNNLPANKNYHLPVPPNNHLPPVPTNPRTTKRAKKAFGSILQSGEGFLRGVSSLFSINSFGNRSINTGGLNQTSEETVKDGFVSLGTGIVGGIVGVVMDPVEGGKKDGVKGAMIGIGKGLAGIFMRPIAGILDAGAGIIGGVRQALNSKDNVILTRHRIPRTFILNKVDQFNQQRGEIMLLIQKHSWNGKNDTESMRAYVNDPKSEFIFCLCSDSFYLVNRDTSQFDVKKNIPLEKVVDARFDRKVMTISVKNLLKKGQKEDYIFVCPDETIAEQIATIIHSYKIEENVF